MASVSQDYVGKAVDLCILETPSYAGAGPVSVGVSSSGFAVSGPYKIVQKFIKYLFTEKGSVPSDTEYGTDLAIKLFGGHISTPIGLQVEFYISMPLAVNYISGTVINPPDSERLTDVQLESMDVVQDTINIRLKFLFRDASVILVPVAISTV